MSKVHPLKADFSIPDLPAASDVVDPILLDPRIASIHRVNPTLPLSALKRIAEFNPDREAVDEQGYPVYLDESDGIPLETYWHAQAMHLLFEGLHSHRQGRLDYFAGGDMFVYYSAEQARNKDYRGPDFFLVNNVSFLPLRKYWAVWKENNRYPDLIVEFISPTTRDEDLKTKYRIYEDIFTTREYVAYDPDADQFFAWRKINGKFQPIVPDSDGRYFLEEAGLSIGTWYGEYFKAETRWVRFFHRHGDVVLFERELATIEAKEAKVFADAEKSRADAEKERADNAKKLADSEKERADALAAEVARLKALLANPS